MGNSNARSSHDPNSDGGAAKALYEKIAKLSPADKLRAAAGMLDMADIKPAMRKTAQLVAQRAIDELALADIFSDKPGAL